MQKADSPPKWAESFDNVADSVFHRPPKLIKPVTYEKLTSQYLSARLPNETERLENMSAAWKEFENLTLKHLRFPTFSVRLLGTHFPLLLDPLFLSRTNFGAAEATPLFLLTKAVSNGALPAQGDVANLVAERINRTRRRCRVCACCPGVSLLSLEGHAGPFDIILLLHIECGEELMSTYIESRAKINPSVVGPADNSGSSGEATPLAKDDQIDKQVLETLGICPLPRTYFEALHQHRSETTSDSSIGVVGYQAATITPSVVDHAKIGGPSEKTAQVATDNGQANGLQSPRNSFVLKGLSVLRDAAAIQDLECDPNMQKRQQLRLQKLFRVAKRWVVHRHIHGLCYGYAGWKELAQLCKDIVMSSTKRTPLILLLQSFFQRALLSKSVRYCAHWKLESQRAATSMEYLIDLAKTLASRSNRLRHSCTLRTCRDVVIENLNQRRQSLFAEANIFKTMTCMVLIRGHHNRQMTVLRHLSALLNELESFSPWNEIIISEKHLYFVLWSSTPVEDERNLNENLQRWCFHVNKSECISSKLQCEIATKATDVPTWVRDYFGGINLLRLVEGHFATPKYQPRRVLDKQFASQLARNIFEKTKVTSKLIEWIETTLAPLGLSLDVNSTASMHFNLVKLDKVLTHLTLSQSSQYAHPLKSSMRALQQLLKETKLFVVTTATPNQGDCDLKRLNTLIENIKQFMVNMPGSMPKTVEKLTELLDECQVQARSHQNVTTTRASKKVPSCFANLGASNCKAAQRNERRLRKVVLKYAS